MSVQLTSGGDDDPAPKPKQNAEQPDQFQVLEELQKALEASRSEIHGVSAPARQPAPAVPRPEGAQFESLRARLENAESLTPWLGASPPFVPDPGQLSPAEVQAIRAATRRSMDPLRAQSPERLFGQPSAPAFLRIAHPQPQPQPQPQPHHAAAIQREPRRHPDDGAWQDDMIQRVAQRSPAGAHEVQDMPRHKRRWLAWTGQAMLACAVAGGVAFCVLQFLDAPPAQSQRGLWALFGSGASNPPANRSVAPRLVTSALSGAANRPVALGVNVDAAPAGAAVTIRGMAPGSRITAGGSAGAGVWRVPVRELSHAAIVPPADFIGTMSLAVDLRLADDSVADSAVQRLQWTTGAPDSVVPKPVKTTTISPASNPFPAPQAAAQRTAEHAPAPAAVDKAAEPPPQSAAAAIGSRQLDTDEVANLVKRGQLAVQNNDMSAARLLLQRAAEAGDGRAALALAATYDPVVLKELGALGTVGDVAQARLWYQRAADAGSDEATRRLQRLAQHSP